MNKLETIEKIIEFITKDRTQNKIPITPEIKADLVIKATEQTKACFLCGKPAYAVALFLPTSSTLFGSASDKQRHFIYGLCNKCIADENRLKKVEDLILSGVTPTN